MEKYYYLMFLLIFVFTNIFSLKENSIDSNHMQNNQQDNNIMNNIEETQINNSFDIECFRNYRINWRWKKFISKCLK